MGLYYQCSDIVMSKIYILVDFTYCTKYEFSFMFKKQHICFVKSMTKVYVISTVYIITEKQAIIHLICECYIVV